MKISILIPCHNEEKTIERCVRSCLEQTRPADQILVIDDGSTDKSAAILQSFSDRITLVRLAKNTGNKSYVQQFGLDFLTGDVFVATDADSTLDRKFIERVEMKFKDPQVVAMAGYVKSLKYNWLTAARELDYLMGQEIDKSAQYNIHFLLVIPGCAGAFRTEVFRNHIRFDHDTITEDLDFTYKMNRQNYRIVYDKKAVTYTQDPADLRSYVNQMRRWYGGGWQNLMKHIAIISRPASALELSLMYVEGLTFSTLSFVLPVINYHFLYVFLSFYALIVVPFAVYGSISRKRWDLIFYSPAFLLIRYINSYVFIEQFVKEVLLQNRNLVWFTPERRR